MCCFVLTENYRRRANREASTVPFAGEPVVIATTRVGAHSLHSRPARRRSAHTTSRPRQGLYHDVGTRNGASRGLTQSRPAFSNGPRAVAPLAGPGPPPGRCTSCTRHCSPAQRFRGERDGWGLVMTHSRQAPPPPRRGMAFNASPRVPSNQWASSRGLQHSGLGSVAPCTTRDAGGGGGGGKRRPACMGRACMHACEVCLGVQGGFVILEG